MPEIIKYVSQDNINEFAQEMNQKQKTIFASKNTADSTFTNVKAFGAVGDGTTDDAVAIQNAIDYAHQHGGVVFFPNGEYVLASVHFNTSDPNTAHALRVYSNMTMLGDGGAVLKQGNASVTHMIYPDVANDAEGYGGCHDIVIDSISFDSNSGDYSETNITPLNLCHGENITIRNCKFYNGHGWHSIEINSCANVLIENCSFVDNGGNTEDIQIDSADGNGNLGMNDNTCCFYITIKNCNFFSEGHVSIGNHSNPTVGNHEEIKIFNNLFNGQDATSYIQFVSHTADVFIFNNTFYCDGVTAPIAVAGTPNYIYENSLIDNTTPIANAISINNWVNGKFLDGIFSYNGIVLPNVPDDLTTLLQHQQIGSLIVTAYNNSVTANRPSNDSGICISFRNPGSGGYGWQIALTNGGFYKRIYTSAHFDAWTAL